MSWDTTVSNLNPYVWLKMDSGLANYGSLGTLNEAAANITYSGSALTYNATGGKTGAFVTFPSASNNIIQFRPTATAPASVTGKTVSYAVWVRTTDIAATGGKLIFNLSSGDANQTGALVFIIPGSNDPNNAGKIVYNANTGSGTGQTYTGGGIAGSLYATVDGNWHLVGAVIDGDTIYWYYDGINYGQSNFTGAFSPNSYQFGVSSYIGDMDDFVMFPYALTSGQMSDLYNSTLEAAPLKYWDGNNWVTPQDALVWNGNSFNSTFGHQVWNGSAWLNITP